MKPDRCQATAASGKPCSAAARPGRAYCLWHDPQADAERRELSRKGGQGRSNAARARKALPAEDLTLREVQRVLCRVLKDVTCGRAEPGVATAAATVGRAIAALAQAADFDERLAALERQIAASGRTKA
jgi:hypothetical protein